MLRDAAPPVMFLLAIASSPAAAQRPADPLAGLSDRCADTRREAAQRAGSAAATDALIALLRTDRFGDVRSAAAERLGELRQPRTLPALLAALDDPHWIVRASAAAALGNFDDTSGVPRLLQLLDDQDDYIRPAAQKSLGALIGRGAITDNATIQQVVAALTRQLRDRSPDWSPYRRHATAALAAMRHPLATGPLLAALQDADSFVQEEAWRGVVASGDRRFVGPLVAIVDGAAPGQNFDREFRQFMAVAALVALKDSAAVDPLRALLRRPNLDANTVGLVIEALGELGYAAAAPEVRRFLTSPQNEVRAAAEEALPRLTNRAAARALTPSERRLPRVEEILGPPLTLYHRVLETAFMYEVPETHRGYLSLDFQSPSCAPLPTVDGRLVVRFGADGRACTSSDFQFASLDEPTPAYRVGPSGRVPIAADTFFKTSAPLPPTERLPAPSTVRVSFFAGTERELHTAEGCDR